MTTQDVAKPKQDSAPPNKLPSAAALPGNVPIGTTVAFASEINKPNEAMLHAAGWLPCDGRPLHSSEYKQLFQVIRETFGAGFEEPVPSKGNVTGEKKGDFNVPDFRGRFLRGSDSGTNREPEAADRTAMRFGGNTIST